jgi:subtilase family serine protease
MLRRMLLPTAIVAATTVVAAIGAPARASGTTWARTATRAEQLVDATDLGVAPAATPMHVVVALPLRNEAALRTAIARRQVLSSPQLLAGYAPTATQAQAVASYLTSNGFSNVTIASNRLLVAADGTASNASTAFDTSIHRYSQNGRTVLANTRDAQVPATLASSVSAVLGLNTASAMRAFANPASSCVVSGVGYPCTYNPRGFWSAYDATSAPTGASTSIGIFAEGDVRGVVTDLRTEEAANGLSAVPVSVVPTGPASSDTSGVDEWDMDTQYSTGMAATVSNLTIYAATSLSDADITTEFNRFAADDTVKAASASFGLCEFAAELDGSMAADDAIFEAAAAQGQTVFTSAGDTGGFCPVGAAVNGVPAGAPDVNYPASSPWVVSLGGTTLVTNSDGSYGNEIAWLAGGGGPSLFESQSTWQSGVSPVPLERTVPDIAMDADPNSGANVYVDGSPEGVGGTSLSSPLALGVWARLESAHANGLGFAGPLVYGASGTAAFHDVIAGDTGPYPATPGYDLATGIGTFDVAQAVSLIH